MSDLTIIPFLNKVNDLILNPLILLVFAVSVIIFMYGVVRFLSLEDGDKAKVEARNAIIWGLVGMAIMFSVYGIIKFILATFGISNSDISPTAQQFLK